MTPRQNAPRRLMRELHQIMASTDEAEVRLNNVVHLVASNMEAEVCSAYFIRDRDILELFATEGLKLEAVHNTRLQVGEGLVGLVASTGASLNLSNAQEHPKFVYRPETGEESYKSMMAVPILRTGKVVGVLVLQNQASRHYLEEEEEALQTVAMVLAELVVSGDLITAQEQSDGDAERGVVTRFVGTVFAEGLAEGVVVMHEPRVEIIQHLSEDYDYQRGRLVKGFKKLLCQIDEIMSAEDILHHGEHREILDVYKLFALDKGWRAKIERAIETGLTAEAAVQKIQIENRSKMIKTDDPYFKERLSDLDDLANRLIRHLLGKAGTAASKELPQNAVVIARNMGPAELLEYDREKLKAVLLQEGSQSSHVSIVARALGIPMLGKLEEGLLDIDEGEEIIVHGLDGEIFIAPPPEILETYRDAIAARVTLLARYDDMRDKPAITKDGVKIELVVNGGLAMDIEGMHRTGAAGVGLFRTEFQFMISKTLPRVRAQAQFYKSIIDSARNKPVTFRTLDIGGDKEVSFLKRDHEENPALGWRAIRIGLDRPALLRYQLRALITAAADTTLRIMFPMITNVEEFKLAKAILEKELSRHQRNKRPMPKDIKVGTMLEVPSLVWQLDELLPLVDFVSIGSNDLMQFFYACDRENPKMSNRYDTLSPSSLGMLRFIVEKCSAGNVPLTLCGEIGGEKVGALALLAIGFRRLSIAPAAVGPVKMMINSLNLSDVERFSDKLLSLSDPSLRSNFEAFARDNDVSI
ncbi:phosphoenolpyruvate--protein phosphotransferase [Emcibacteraceae bacterium]|nr:phosphoenolpyruvate--protein phosphotransferase [Emcibacteraceae bacterium]MDC1428989.1 phosphoenolpyruvate--protein phosphotransferase [Emcibacteraceae bacterium]